MHDDPFILRFENTSMADANRYAADLMQTIRDVAPDVVVQQRRDRPEAQDFGATLAIVLGTASVTAIANGIAGWLQRHSGARIEIDSRGAVVARNLDSGDAARIAEVFSQRQS